MALNTNKVLKKYYSIKEVSEMLDIPESTLRYWEKEFKQISPKKNSKGIRQYTVQDIEQVKSVFHLVKEKNLTHKGAKSHLDNKLPMHADTEEIVERLKNVRDQLKSIMEELDATPPCGLRL
ncbi:MAG: MerR family transcriptional regulator [Bacteroidaceae bacterium]|nr:MerR family transcriptional regulator [Bacteroidaceae bacterium]